MPRISVVGTSCSGKTTLSSRIAGALDIPHIELDSLYHLPGWKERDSEEFRAIVREQVAVEDWVCDGNYGVVRDLVWSRATTIIFLDLDFRVVMRRALSRTLRRFWTQEQVCGENRETLRSIVGLEGIPIWVIRTHRRNRRRYRHLLGPGGPNVPEVIILRTEQEVEGFLCGITTLR